MRRRRPIQTAQTNIRLDTALIAQLEAAARTSRTNFSEEVRARLVDSFNPAPVPGFADFRDAWLRRLRRDVEAVVPPEKIEEAWAILRAIESESAKFYGYLEDKLSPYVRDSRIRELLRGVPVLPDETKAKPKATQQE
jgi:hypothetical protein